MSNSSRLVKLDSEEREYLEELLDGQGWPVLLKAVDQLVERIGRDVLTLAEPDRVLKRKAEYDGAKELLLNIKNLKQKS